MKQREKAFVYGGVALLALVTVWKLTHSNAAASADAGSVTGTIMRIQEGDRVRRTVEGLIKELAIEVPQTSAAEQETQIRADLARKAQQCKLVVISQIGINSTVRGPVSRSVQMVQYRLDLYGLYEDFMRFMSALEQSPIPYVIRDLQFESSPKAPTVDGPQEGQPEGQPESEQGGRDRRSRRGGPEGSNEKASQPNGRVHVTMRVQGYLFPVEIAVAKAPAPAASTVQTSAPAVHAVQTSGTASQPGGAPNQERPASNPAPESRR